MPNLLSRVVAPANRSTPAVRMSWDQYLATVQAGDFMKSLATPGQLDGVQGVENLRHVSQRSSTIGSAVLARALLLSQVRFQFRNISRTSPQFGNLFGNQSLRPIEYPDPFTRPHLLSLLSQDVDFAGTAYLARTATGGVERLRPDLVRTVLSAPVNGSPANMARDARVTGWLYFRDGYHAQPDSFHVDDGDVAVWAPEPLTEAPWVGQSWITGLLRDASTDDQASRYISQFFANSATPSMIVRPDKMLTPAQVKEFQEIFDESYSGVSAAHRAMFIGGGSDVSVVGSKLGDLAIESVTGHFETRVAARSRVPAVILGVREGMQGSALNSGNYAQTRRLWADGWVTPTIQSLCASLELLFPAPTGSELSYDPGEILFLQEDAKDAAEIAQMKAATVRQLVDAGYDPDAAALVAGLPGLAGSHSGLFSVQLQPLGGNNVLPPGGGTE